MIPEPIPEKTYCCRCGVPLGTSRKPECVSCRERPPIRHDHWAKEHLDRLLGTDEYRVLRAGRRRQIEQAP